ncbi:cbb3-type cytochrome c oxidase subunit I [Thiohalomonas denitrificans]|uniref:cbb3-type cytochrome c oxidase subunit I n=1 Tax=Thiohalomonas denitrificans TaxID=415747 RepID=UPI0026EDA6D8|nr:cbb3-type cytochrome c oxidase subunit I [Thiohalomonas denitrificans]
MMSHANESGNTQPAQPLVNIYVGVSAVVLLLMMIVGLVMRLAQGEMLDISPGFFYQLLTVHGAGMVGIAALGSAAIMWYFASRYLDLSRTLFVANLLLFLVGVVMILGSILGGGFAAGWTFLYPLPAKGMGLWGTGAAALFLGGLLLIGTGFLILHLDFARAITRQYGSLGQGLGWPQLFGRDSGEAPPPTVVASTMVTIVNILGITAGAAILVMSLVNLYVPSFTIDPLLAKNLIYFFGHVFINATIYMAIIAVYEILPLYAKRPWKPNKAFLAAWTASTIMVLIVYPHHLLMDFAMPTWMMVMGQVISYTSGLPVLVVTTFGALMLIYRSGMRWDVTSSLLVLSVFGWAAGVIPAIVDATIRVNMVMHNTLWVPGHFHFYLLIGVASMLFGFMHFLGKESVEQEDRWFARWAFWGFMFGSLGFVFMFLYSGANSVPRRFAEHLPQWVPYDQIASAFVAVVVTSVLVFALQFLARLFATRPVALATEVN